MERHVMWVPADRPGLEHLHLIQTDNGITFNSVIIGIENEPYRIRYEISCDAGWHVKRLSVVELDSAKTVSLQSDGEGNWITPTGEPVEELLGCLDIDISNTPFTNAISIRRLNLKPGESADVPVVYVDVPALTYRPARQRYTCLEYTARGGLYQFEWADEHYTARLPVDGDGLVINYPQEYRRVLPE